MKKSKSFGWVLVTVGIYIFMTLTNLYFTNPLVSSFEKNLEIPQTEVLILASVFMVGGVLIWLMSNICLKSLSPSSNVALIIIIVCSILVSYTGLYISNSYITFFSYRSLQNVYDIPTSIYCIVGSCLIISGSVILFTKPKNNVSEEKKESLFSQEDNF